MVTEKYWFYGLLCGLFLLLPIYPGVEAIRERYIEIGIVFGLGAHWLYCLAYKDRTWLYLTYLEFTGKYGLINRGIVAAAVILMGLIIFLPRD